MTPTNAEVQDLLGNPEVVEALAAGLAGELLKHKREVIRLQAALETTTLEAREAEARADRLTGELCDARGENAALRARALPVIEWRGKSAVSGGFLLEVREQFGWELEISHNGTIVLRGGTPGGTEDQIKAICEAAFLRLVGAGS